jgi:hypothetical protein
VGASRTENTGNRGGQTNTITVGAQRTENTGNRVGQSNSITVGGSRNGNVYGGPGNFNRSPIVAVAPRGTIERTTVTGGVVRMRSNGGLSDLHDPRQGLTLHRGLNGNQVIQVNRPDNSQIFAARGRAGYIQRPFDFQGHDFAQRTYVDRGHTFHRVYRDMDYHGHHLAVYVPAAFFAAGFYGWAYHRWHTPITYQFGFGGSPWYVYYGYYFQPYPTYAEAAPWLTDYMISQDLQAAYAAQQQAGEMDGVPQGSGGTPILSPGIKQQIDDEVRNELALENQEAQLNAQGQAPDPGSSGIPRLLSDGRPHVFVVGNPLDVTDSYQAECALSDGDVLQLQTAPDPSAASATLVVLASKGGRECRQNSMVTVQLTDLQEMQNQMRATIDSGLQELQAKQGTGGLPPMPASAQGQPAPAQYAAAAPPPDPNAGAVIQQQVQQADQTAQQAQAASQVPQGYPAPAGGYQDPNAQAPPPTGYQDPNAQTPPPNQGTYTQPADPNAQAAPPAGGQPAGGGAPSISLGMTPDQVQATLGTPTSIANLGAKMIYNYNGMKVIFQNGVVSDVQ